MNAKAFDFERLSAELKLWDAELMHLEESVHRLGPEFQTAVQAEADDLLQMLQHELAALRQLRDEAYQALQQMAQAGDPEWRIQGARAERALARLGEAFEQSRNHFGE
jgi:Skp family chaperone for outer membrane proteins